MASRDPLRVRVALHTGEADLRAGDYYGAAVNRCARLGALAHGGQVLLSGVTAELVRAGLPPEVGLRDLGRQRLKGLAASERVFELVQSELETALPPLPVALTSFVGREVELAAVQRHL